jgi:hypothetical protein
MFAVWPATHRIASRTAGWCDLICHGAWLCAEHQPQQVRQQTVRRKVSVISRHTDMLRLVPGTQPRSKVSKDVIADGMCSANLHL